MKTKLSIKEVCSELGLTEVYVRRMILKGKLKSEKIEIAQNTYKHLIERSEVERWRKEVKGSARTRKDGRNKYTLYGTKEEIEKVNELLQKNKLQTPILRTNQKKVKTTE